tara:strand:- start:1565 stop:1753 length:189 start_codon:yes stop_codon:yes gene_type:complete
MSDKEFEEMIRLFERLQKLISKSNFFMEDVGQDSSPIVIPSEVYDDICKELGSKEIRLMGIS